MNTKQIKLNRNIIGKWVTVKWQDVGRRDCVVVDILTDGKLNKRSEFKVFEPFSRMARITGDQILEIRGYLKAQ